MRLKLFLSFTLVVLISVTLVAVIARRGAVNEVRTFMFRGGMLGLDEMAASLENYYHSHGSWQGVQTLLENSQIGMPGMGGMMGQRLVVADASATIVADTQQLNTGKKMDQASLAQSIPLNVDGAPVGYLAAAGGMGFNAGNQQQILSRLNRGVVVAGLLAVGLGLVISTALAYTLIRPVRELTLAAGMLSQGDLAHRVTIQGDDELASLGHAFNQMADSLQQAEDARRAMTADIAHELRTPLAVQRANLEALQDGVYPLTVSNLEPVIEQNHLLTRLVEDLRTLALADAGQIELERTPTDLADLLSRMLERFQPQALSQQVSLTFSAPGQSLPAISVDPTRIEQIITNLLSNALRYTPAAGRVELSLDSTPSTAVVRVHDSGPGIPADALPFIFGRFYRADKSRNRLEGGSGLGLAIARQLARAHGGDLTAANHPSGGALFTLILPEG